MSLRAMLLAAAVVFGPATAMAQEGAYHPPSAEPVRRTITSINLQHVEKLKALREEGLALQRADGGTLTPAHLAELQRKYDKLWESYHRNVARADRFSVNADGSARE